ncbi:MAG: anti-sigma factor [Alphaproteobacteria bacterium]|nr:anti-sigma factor [Alphaproteobacteria bacterium]
MPSFHPSQTLLMDYAAGSLGEASAVLIATHVSLCPECRAEAARIEAVGGALIETIEPVPLAHDGMAAVLRKLDERPDAPAPIPSFDAETQRLVPAPLRRHLGGNLEDIRWRSLGAVRQIDLAVTQAGGHARLLRLKGGAKVPRHSHDGLEMIIVLAGGFSDQSGHYLRGDVAVAGSDITHAPVADAGEDCICFAVVDGSIKLSGPLGRLVNLFVRT